MGEIIEFNQLNTLKVPEERIRKEGTSKINEKGRYVLYWMTSARRLHSNFGLQFAVEEANKRGLPLLVFEALRRNYRWANKRHHTFILEGMKWNAEEAEGLCNYRAWVETSVDTGKDILGELAKEAALVVTDYYPCFFLPRMIQKAGASLPVALFAVDSNGVIPLQSSDRHYTTAHSFRRFVQKTIPRVIRQLPLLNPLETLGNTSPIQLSMDDRLGNPCEAISRALSSVDSLNWSDDVSIGELQGGRGSALEKMERFLEAKLDVYHENRNAVDDWGTSLLSPYLHYGHIGGAEIVREVLVREGWDTEHLPEKASGSREGWWGVTPGSEAFLDQIITWRELGFHFCHHNLDTYDTFEGLPEWAKITLNEHASDKREETYSLEELEGARTADPIWNAAQRQLVQTGLMHNYLRMLWGKKVLQWSASPREALERLVHLNNKYALDGRDPNSYSGIFWVFGRFDRAWGPERPIFGKTRYMTSDSTRRKLKLDRYLTRFAG